MTPEEYVGKRVTAFDHGPCRVLACVERTVLALEVENLAYQGMDCHHQGRYHVPSGRGAWVRYNDCKVIPEDSPLIAQVRSYISKELSK